MHTHDAIVVYISYHSSRYTRPIEKVLSRFDLPSACLCYLDTRDCMTCLSCSLGVGLYRPSNNVLDVFLVGVALFPAALVFIQEGFGVVSGRMPWHGTPTALSVNRTGGCTGNDLVPYHVGKWEFYGRVGVFSRNWPFASNPGGSMNQWWSR